MHHLAKFIDIGSSGCRDIPIFRFFKMAAVRYLGFVCRVSRPPTSIFGGLYRCAVSGWNPCSSLDNMTV